MWWMDIILENFRSYKKNETQSFETFANTTGLGMDWKCHTTVMRYGYGKQGQNDQ